MQMYSNLFNCISIAVQPHLQTTPTPNLEIGLSLPYNLDHLIIYMYM